MLCPVSCMGTDTTGTILLCVCPSLGVWEQGEEPDTRQFIPVGRLNKAGLCPAQRNKEMIKSSSEDKQVNGKCVAYACTENGLPILSLFLAISGL